MEYLVVTRLKWLGTELKQFIIIRAETYSVCANPIICTIIQIVSALLKRT